MTLKHLLYTFLVLFIGIPTATLELYAQEETMEFHNLEPEQDVFQDAFFSALRHKAIGNYRLAIEELDKAQREVAGQEERQRAVDFERAQNHYYLKEYQESISYLRQLLSTQKQREVLFWLYQVYMETREFYEAKLVMADLLEYSEVYLPNFYMLYVELTNQPEEALKLLDKVFKDKTNTRQVSFYKDLIQESLSGNKKAVDSKKSDLSDSQELVLQNYLQNKEWEEAEMYMELMLQDETYAASIWNNLKDLPDKDQLSNSLISLFSKKSIPDKSKQNLLGLLIASTNNKELLFKLSPEINKYLDANSLKVLGEFFVQHSEKKAASELYLMSLAISFDNYSLIVETLELLMDAKDYDEQLELADTAIEYYPLQPVLYLYKGEALLGMKLWGQAKKVLEEGASYVIDYPKLEEEFKDKIQKANNHLN